MKYSTTKGAKTKYDYTDAWKTVKVTLILKRFDDGILQEVIVKDRVLSAEDAYQLINSQDDLLKEVHYMVTETPTIEQTFLR